MRSRFIFSLLCTFLIFQGCVDDRYDLGNINTDVTLFQDSISLKLGQSKGSNMSDLFFNGIDEISIDENGMFLATYVIESDFPLPNINDIQPNPVNLYSNYALNILPNGDVNSDIQLSIENSNEFSFSFPYGSPLEELDHATFDTNANYSTVNIDISVNELSVYGGNATADVTLEFPASLGFDGLPNNQISIPIDLTENTRSYNSQLKLNRADAPDQSGRYTVNNSILLNIKEGAYIYATPNASISIIISINNIRFITAYGKFKIDDSKMVSIKIADLYKYVDEDDNNQFSVTEPYVLMKTESNVGFPINMNVSFIPFKNNEPIRLADRWHSPLTANSQILLHPSESPTSSPKINNFAFGPVIQPEWESEWEEMIGDPLNLILKEMPDSLLINARGITFENDNTEKMFLTVNSRMDMEYRLIIPFKMEHDFHVTLKDTLMDVLDKDVRDMLFKANQNPTVKDSIVLFGTVESGIPLHFEMNIYPLDENMNRINVDLGKQEIDAGREDRMEESPFELSIRQDDYEAMRNAEHFEVVYLAKSDQLIRNTPITENSLLKINMKVKKWGGITFSSSNEEEENNNY